MCITAVSQNCEFYFLVFTARCTGAKCGIIAIACHPPTAHTVCPSICRLTVNHRLVILETNMARHLPMVAYCQTSKALTVVLIIH